jgi:5'-methylthioinosine phosphorylase
MEAPRPQGDRLALIFGHSLATDVFANRGTLVTAHGVEAVDCDAYVVLSRHGHTSFTPAHLIDHRAQISALAELGCRRIVGLASTGTLRTDWAVGTTVAPDDFFAPGVAPSFFDDARGHRIPGFDAEWRAEVLDRWRAAGNGGIVDGGVYAQTSGPRFETPAEIRMLAQFADLVGMTIADECVLAAEATMPYMAICSVDNIANGLDVAPLTVDEFRANKARNEPLMATAVAALLDHLAGTTR